jgi:hypothetical protein
MSKLNLWTTISLVSVFCAVEVIASPAQTFTNLVNFDGANGYVPNAVVHGGKANVQPATQSTRWKRQQIRAHPKDKNAS